MRSHPFSLVHEQDAVGNHRIRHDEKKITKLQR
jgi:hypothetical protein